MFIPPLRSCLLASAMCLPTVIAHGVHCRRSDQRGPPSNSENTAVLNSQSLFQAAQSVPLVTVSTEDDETIAANTTAVISVDVTAEGISAETISSTALVIARDVTSAYSGYSGLNDRGIPHQVLAVPSTGAVLPSLNDSATHGNYGLIVIVSEVSYDYNGTYRSALTDDQWLALYNYQVSFGVRMVRLDVSPSADTGTSTKGGCCSGEQLVYISNTSAFPQAGLRTGAGLSTTGLYHYPAKIIDPSIAVEVAQFAAPANKSDGTGISTAAVINDIDGRQQMVWFLPFATDWSVASNFLQHAWIDWATRGLYIGYRRAMLNTQIDDMFLETPMYDTGINFRTTPEDVEHHITVMSTINKKLNSGNPGSNWVIEVGHNGNGNIETSGFTRIGENLCNPGPIEYPDQIDTALEFAKPLGSGSDLWPTNASEVYANYSNSCVQKDALLTWWQVPDNMNAFAHISHTFTHEDQDNSTYFDVYREISWNIGWLAQVGLSNATKYSSTGIIPPAITGLHNGDALRAWYDNGIIHVVGDNTRPPLLNSVNEHWPLMSTVSANGFAGIQINPRWATNIYYNCDYAACCVAEWAATSHGVGDFNTILGIEKDTNTRHLLGLHHEPYMFHQANLRYTDADNFLIDGVSQTMSLFELWVTLVTSEFTRLVNWPLISLKHDDMSASFAARMARDQCKPQMSYKMDPIGHAITTITLGKQGFACQTPIPVTFPGPVVDQKGATPEQVGHDPLTLWVTLIGSPVTFQLKTPIPIF